MEEMGGGAIAREWAAESPLLLSAEKAYAACCLKLSGLAGVAMTFSRSLTILRLLVHARDRGLRCMSSSDCPLWFKQLIQATWRDVRQPVLNVLREREEGPVAQAQAEAEKQRSELAASLASTITTTTTPNPSVSGSSGSGESKGQRRRQAEDDTENDQPHISPLISRSGPGEVKQREEKRPNPTTTTAAAGAAGASPLSSPSASSPLPSTPSATVAQLQQRQDEIKEKLDVLATKMREQMTRLSDATALDRK
jgi:hypothetical protein